MGKLNAQKRTQPYPRGPTHIFSNDGGGGMRGPSDFLRSEILTKGDFFGYMKDAGIFLGHKKKKRRDFFWVEKKN